MSDVQSAREILARLRDGSLSREEGVRLLRAETGHSVPASAGVPERLQEAWEERLAPVIARATGTTPDRVRPDVPFERYGFDSVMALTVVRELSESFGSLPPSLLFEVRSVRDLAVFLVDKYPERAEALLGTHLREVPAATSSVTPEPTMAEAASEPHGRPGAVDLTDARSGARQGGGETVVVGMSGRFPLADTIEEFWDNLQAGRDCIEEIPADRWDHNRVFDPEPGTPGKSYSRWGGFLRDVDRFDHSFFHISPRQARYMDPQERLLLQEVWHACEDAGIPPSLLAGRPVGVYAGVMYSQYELWGMGPDAYHSDYLGASYASIVNRVSHYYDLHGPSVAIDTMCSSSLVALEQASDALLAGRIEYAVVAGVNLTVHPKKYVDLSQGRFASTDGRCRAFGEGGDGYVPGEAVVVTILTREDIARAEGLRVRGVVRGIATGHGGHTNGYTTPSPEAQADVMRAAMSEAGVVAADVEYVEAHGTGTSLGDAVEMRSLAKALTGSPEHPRRSPCAIGSVKSNVGHCEAAAGLVGLVKVLLQLEHERLVPSLHAATINPALGIPTETIRLQRESRPWPRVAGSARVSGLSSFGAGGMNAHVIVAEGDPEGPDASSDASGPSGVVALPLSARSGDSLAQACRALAEHLRTYRPALRDVEHTLVTGREHLEVRGVVFAGTHEEAVERLGELARSGAGSVVGTGDEPRSVWAHAWVGISDHPGPAAPWAADGGLVSLPGYIFARDRHWAAEPAASGAIASGTAPVATRPTTTRVTVRREDPVIADHVVHGRPVVPGSAVLEMVLDAAGPDNAIVSCAWPAPIVLENPAVAIEIAIAGDRSHCAFEVSDADTGRRFCTGLLEPAAADLGRWDVVPDEWEGATRVDVAAAYERFARLGLRQGPSLRVLSSLRVRGDEAVAGLAEVGAVREHPVAVLLDAALQSLLGFAMDETSLKVPFALARMTVTPGLREACWVHATRRGSGPATAYDLDLANTTGRVVARLEGVTMLTLSAPETTTALLGGEEPPGTHRLAWRRRPTVPAEETITPGVVLVAGEGLEELAVALRARGWHGPISRLGKGGRPLPAGTDIADGALVTVVLLSHLGAASEAPEPEPAAAAVAQARAGLDTLLDAVPALLTDPRVAAVGVVDVHRDDDPDHVGVLPAVRVLAGEGSPVSGSALVVEADDESPSWAGAVAARVLQRPARMSTQYVESDAFTEEVLDRVAHARPSARVLRPGGVYLLVGGRGGVGRVLATRLAERVGARLVLAGRSPVDDAARRLVNEVEAHGGEALCVQADCATEPGARAAVAAALDRFGRIDGVFHLAGVVRDALAAHKTRATIDEVISAKLWSAVWIDAATAHLPLDLWVAFGSASSYVGVPGQVDYAWANAQLVALVRRREALRASSRRSGSSVVISWPLIASDGMGVDAFTLGLLRQHLGWDPMPAEAVLDLIEQALAAGDEQYLPVSGDPAIIERWLAHDWGTSHAAHPDTMRPQAATLAPATAPTQEDSVDELSRTRLADGGSAESAPRAVVEHLRALVAHELGMATAALDPHATFDRVGLESVMVLNLSRLLGDQLGPVPTTVFFEQRTVAELADWLWREHALALRTALGLAEDPGVARPESVVVTPGVGVSVPAAPVPAISDATAPRRMGTQEDPIAIVGVSGRYPQADDLDEFWLRLSKGEDLISDVPSDRWDHDAFFDPEVGRPGRTYTRWGGFLRDAASFDARFFSISRAEAVQLDPQERVFLETAWHALEDAGYTPQGLAGLTVGVFAGVMYAQYQMYGADRALQAQGILPGSQLADVANRVSYCLDLHGPSISVDTMCSSSLTAIHLACSAIREGDCDVALAGGVNIISHPYRYLQMAQGRFAASDGRCHSFGAGGDGYVPGEGVGVVTLKRLSAALADGDRIHGVIRGSAINHGGRTNGFTVPSVTAQAAVIRRALERAGVRPEEIDYVEAHGTGTALGDPIEVAALGTVLRGSGRDCPIGSVKSNIGHLESAAGIAALTKVLLQMRYGELVPSLHSQPPNPEMDLRGLRVQQHRSAWTRRSGGGGSLLAAVSSFGAGGSNAHLVVEAPPRRAAAAPAAGPHLIRLSARTTTALRRSASLLADRLAGTEPATSAAAPAGIAVGAGASEPLELLLATTADVLGLKPSDVDGDSDPVELGIDPTTATVIGSRLVGVERGDELSRLLLSVQSLREVVPSVTAETRPATAEELDLADVAYTLAEGRVELDERLAIVCADRANLVASLREYAETGRADAGFVGSRSAGGEHAGDLTALFGTASGVRFLEDLAREERWAELAQLWVRGYQVPSAAFGRQGRRESLPGYPFEGEALWVPTSGLSHGSAAGAAPVPRAATTAHAASFGEPVSPVGDLAEPAPALAPLDPEPAMQRVVAAIRDAMAEVLDADPDSLNLDVPHAEFGVDSVFAVEIVERINTALRTSIGPTDFFHYSTIEQLAGHLVTVLPPAQEAPVAPATVAPEPVVSAAKRTTEASDVVPSSTSGEPIAVIGMAGRFPQADDVAALWDNLRSGVDAVGEVPVCRWDVDRYFDVDRSRPRRTYSKWSSVLDDPARFDAAFFGCSPREAQLMDPQHRLFLETAWHAMEDAGVTAEDVRGARVGVYVGVSAGDFQNHLRDQGIEPEGYTFTGNHPAMLPSRLAYHLDLRGPAVSIDTSCSSSLVAIHLACEAIREGEVDAAFAGGVALLFTPELHILASKAGMLSPTGRCRTFDAAADGFVPGESVGVVYLKRMSAALADSDRILGVIRGSGMNQDGRSNGITAPNMAAQRDLEVEVYSRFGIDPTQIGYVETHGTGTRLGDPIEVEALSAAFRRFTERTGFCALGSVKSHLGHTLTAAGVTGVLKALLMLRHRAIPPTLHVDELNPHLKLAGSAFRVATRSEPFPAPEGGRRHIAVSSFGFSGTNAHLVLAEGPADAPVVQPDDGSPVVVPVSARSEDALQRVISDLAEWLDDHDPIRPVARTLARRRTHLPVRAVFVASDVRELRRQLRSWTPVQPARVAPDSPAPLQDACRTYLAGQAVDWAAIYPGVVAPVPLPAYPFDRSRHWPPGLTVPVVERVPSTATEAVPVAPASATDPASGSFSDEVVLDPTEPLVADHVVDGHPMLPAAGHLSLLVDLLERTWGSPRCTITHAVWMTPVLVDEPRRLTLTVEPEKGRWRWQITSRGIDGVATVHSRGLVRLGAEKAAPVSPLESRLQRDAVSPSLLYYRFLAIGIRYGACFQTVQGYWVDDHEVVAHLRRPEHEARSVSAGVLDGVLQSMLVLLGDDPDGLDLPFAANEIRVYGRVPDAAVSVVRQLSDSECSLNLALTSGDPCIVVDRLMFRTVPREMRMHHLCPDWVEVGAGPVRAVRGTALVVTDDDWAQATDALRLAHEGCRVDRLDWADPHLGERVAEIDSAADLDTVYLFGVHPDAMPRGAGDARDAEQLAQRAVRVLRALSGGRHASLPLQIVIITVDGIQHEEGDPVCPTNALFFGLQRSLRREHPSWQVRCVDVSSAELLALPVQDVLRDIMRFPVGAGGSEIAVRGGRGWERVLRETERRTGSPSRYRDGATYVVLGGAGGVGFATAMHLASTAGATVVLLGRRPEDEDISRRLAMIREAGGHGIYLACDATDLASLRAVVQQVTERFGPVRGAFHSALVLRDRMLYALTDDDVRRVVAPKMTGAQNFATALADQPLDFLVFYSSAQSFVGGAGQSTYAAASTYLDAYAASLRLRGVPAEVVNWGYWGDVGIVTDDRYRQAMAAQGVGSITPDAGMQSVDEIIAHRAGQTVAIMATGAGLAPLLPDPADGSAPGTSATHAIDAFVQAHARMVRMGLTYALAQLGSLGFVDSRGDLVPDDELLERGLDASHLPLVRALVAEAATEGAQAGRTTSEARAALAAVAEEQHELTARVELLLACVDQYGQVLTGEVDGTSVLFPGSSSRLVEAVYTGDPLSHALNQLVANAVEEEIAATQRELCILEVGAGTGGTTGAVVPVLHRHRGRASYVFTDVAAGFLRSGRRILDGVPGCDFRRLDIEASPAGQGVEPGTVDVVIAANVLHATADLRRTLGHAAQMLRPGGALILLETTSVSGLATMTFGLLDGWWSSTDGIREPGSPLASASTWSRLLREQGFTDVDVRHPGGEVGQHVIVARLSAADAASLGAPARRDGAEAGPARLRRAVADEVVAAVAETLRMDAGAIDRDLTFTEFGVDSIILVELVTVLNGRLGLALKPTVVFDHPSVNALVDHLIATEPGLSVDATPPTPATAAPAAPAGSSGDPDVLALLADGAVSVDEAMERLLHLNDLEDLSS